MKFTKIVKALSIAGFIGLSACGANNASVVKDVQITSYTQQGAQFISVRTLIDAASILLPGAQIAIMNPKNPAVPYGYIQLVPSLAGGSELRTDLNISALTKDRPLDSVGALPNGLPLPVGGFIQGTSFSVPVSQSTRLYMDLDSAAKRAFLGVSMGIKEFKTTIVSGLFLPLPANLNINGVAGIFTGPQAYQSGFAIFVDASRALAQLTLPQASLSSLPRSAAAVSSKVATFSAAAASPYVTRAPYQFHSWGKNSNDVYAVLQRANSRGRRVTLE